jgi:predicted small integral membrane protein
MTMGKTFAWMVWTMPVAIFFICIALMLVGMTIWELRSPTIERKGILPIRTTRGDRLFIGLLMAAYINLAWVGLTDINQYFGTTIGFIALIIVMMKG